MTVICSEAGKLCARKFSAFLSASSESTTAFLPFLLANVMVTAGIRSLPMLLPESEQVLTLRVPQFL